MQQAQPPTAYGTTGFEEQSVTAVGVAEVPVLVTDQRAAVGREEEVCGSKVFSEVEDQPIVKERVER